MSKFNKNEWVYTAIVLLAIFGISVIVGFTVSFCIKLNNSSITNHRQADATGTTVGIITILVLPVVVSMTKYSNTKWLNKKDN